VGHQAKQFDRNTLVQVFMTAIPCLIIVGLAYPATKTMIAMKDTSHADITVKATGYQWKWRYDYLGEDIGFYSDLSTPREQIENRAREGRELPSGGGPSAGGAGGQEGAHPGDGKRRDPLVVGAGIRCQAGRDTRFRARLGGSRSIPLACTVASAPNCVARSTASCPSSWRRYLKRSTTRGWPTKGEEQRSRCGRRVGRGQDL